MSYWDMDLSSLILRGTWDILSTEKFLSFISEKISCITSWWCSLHSLYYLFRNKPLLESLCEGSGPIAWQTSPWRVGCFVPAPTNVRMLRPLFWDHLISPEKNTNVPFLRDRCLAAWNSGGGRIGEFWVIINGYFQLHISFLPSLTKPDPYEPSASPRSLAVCAFSSILGCGFLCAASLALFISFPPHLNLNTL